MSSLSMLKESQQQNNGDWVIDLANLEVSYGEFKAVQGISFQVRQNEIFGLLGPNGAGKTTTLSAIEGLVKPSGGHVKVLGLDIVTQTQEVKRKLGISLQTTAFFDNLKLGELLQFYAALYEVFLSKAQVIKLLERFELAEKINVQAHELSGGQQQRVALALAIANDPAIVILDEPTTGLDPQSRRNVWEIIRQMRAEGRTIIITTHYMEEAQELCQRIGIIDQGKIIALDTPGGLINSLKAASRLSVTALLPKESLQALPGVTSVHYEGPLLHLTTNNTQETLLGLQKLAVVENQLLTDLSIKQPDLEDVFIALTGKKIR